jgi:hypothetical protein
MIARPALKSGVNVVVCIVHGAAIALLASSVVCGMASIGEVKAASSSSAFGQEPSAVVPLWFQSTGEDSPASVENDTPFPSSKFIINAQWTTPRYYPNPKLQAADIIPVTWASDGNSYVIGDDGSVGDVKATTVMARIVGSPPSDNSIPQINFQLLAHDAFSYGCPKSVSLDSCYSVGFTNVDNVFYAVTYDKGYPVVGDHPPGRARIDYSVGTISQSSWVHGDEDFPAPVDSGAVSFVEVGRGESSHDECPANTFPHGCIYAIVLHGGYQDPLDPNGMDQFNATHVFLARMAAGTPGQNYQEVAYPSRWQWFTGFDSNNQPTWIRANESLLQHSIRSLSYPRKGRAGCAADGQEECSFWGSGDSGHINYPHMTYDAALRRYFLTFTDWYYRDFKPPSEKGPMVQGGAEGIVLEAPYPWGPWSFAMRSPFLGSGNGYGPSFPVQWEGPRTSGGQDLWMVWAANFGGCGKPQLVPADQCQGVYGMNLRRLHVSLADDQSTVGRPWFDQEVGFASPGHAKLQVDSVVIAGNGNLADATDPFGQYHDSLYHDAFHYMFQRVQGSGSVKAQLGPAEPGMNSGVGPQASAGLLLRESTYVLGQTRDAFQGRRLSSGDIYGEAARYAYLGVKKDGTIFFQYRDYAGVVRSRTQAGGCSGGCSLQLGWLKNRAVASLCGSDHTCREFDSHVFAQPLSNSVTMGLAVNSDSASTFPHYLTYEREFSHLSVHTERPAAAKP